MASDNDYSIESHFDACQRGYADQKTKTTQAAQRANRELERLTQAVDVPEDLLRGVKNGNSVNFELPEEEKELANVKKLLFMNAQVSLAKSILTSLLAQDAAWEQKDFLSEPNEEEQRKRIDHYQTATRLLKSMQHGFDDAAAIDSSYFGPVWKAYVNILNTYPKSCLWGVGAFGLLGGLAGAGHVSLNIGFRGFLIALFGEASFMSGAFVLGSAAGIVAGAVLLSAIWFYQCWTRNKEVEEAEEVRAMKKKIASIAEKELSTKELLELEDLFSKVFHQPVNLARSTMCPICHEHFRADGGNSHERALKAPRCQGNHWCHQKCLRTWQFHSGSDACVICQQ